MQQEKQDLSERSEFFAAVILLLRVAALVCLAALCWHLLGYHFLLDVVALVLIVAVISYAVSGAALASAVLRNVVGRLSFVPGNKWFLTGLGIAILLGVLGIFVAEFAFLTRSVG